MPKYQVLLPIEHNGTIFVCADTNAPEKARGAGMPGMRPVDVSGEIELTEKEAAPLVHGQVPLFQGKPEPIGAAEFREKKAKKDAEEAATKAAAEKAEYEEFVAFKAAKAAKKK